MLDQAWEMYRGWAARARALQAATRRWNVISFAAAALAAVLGTASTQATLSAEAPTLAALSAGTALLAALSAWLGRERFAIDSETGWMKARVVAEGIKSECFRYAATLAPYDGSAAGDAIFRGRLAEIKVPIDGSGLSPLPVLPATAGTAPAVGMTTAWYLEHRLKEQQRYFVASKARSEAQISRLRLLSLATMLFAALCGGATVAGLGAGIAGWVGVVTTIAASVAALSMGDRARALAMEAAKVINRLDDVCLGAGQAALDDLVGAGEHVLQEENARWIEVMTKSLQKAPTPPVTSAGDTV